MTTIADIVELVYPTVSGVSLPVSAPIWVVFDREIDESSLDGSFFVTGPDQDTWSGPDLALFKDYESLGSESQILQSPDYHGIVQGTITLERLRVDTYDSLVGYDYTGNGLTYRTKAIFTPTNRLSPDTTYTVYISGDDDTSDTLNVGIKSRSVFDTLKGSNLGTGTALFSGGYTGTATNKYNVQITTAGQPGTSKFIWWRDSDPALLFGPFYTKQSGVTLDEGVEVAFGEGTYVVNDSFSVVVKQATLFTGNLVWPFETGSGSIEEVPSTASTLITGSPTSTSTSTSSSTSTFSVLETSPEDQATNLDIVNSDLDISILFNLNVDLSTVTTGTVSVVSEAVNGDETNITVSGILPVTFAASGAELIVTVVSGLLFENNVVTVTLDDTIASTTGVELGTDYSFYFTTTYNPLYSSIRKLRLEVGSLISSIPNDTLNLAIFEASLEADQLQWNTYEVNTEYFEFARRQWVSCKAAEILLSNALGTSGGLKAKRLGDLEVQYDPKSTQNGLDRVLACLAKWTPVIQAGGYTIQKPMYFVKGEMDPDRPAVGRLWEGKNMDTDIVPAANVRKGSSSSRRWKHGYYSKWGK